MRGTDRVMAGSRLKYTPDYIDFSYQNLVDAIADAIDKQSQEEDKSFFTDKRNNLFEDTSKDLNFDTLMLEFDNIINRLVARGENEFKDFYAPRVTQITDKYLGRGQKVSQMSREQVEALSLIIDDLHELESLKR